MAGRGLRGVIDLGGNLQARPDQDLGIAGRDLDDLDRAQPGDERERMQDPAGRGTPGGDHRATEHGQAQDQREQHERLEEIAWGLHAEQEPAPAVFSGRGLVKGKVSNRGRGLGDGRLAERIGLKAVAAGELDEVDQMAFQLRKRQLNSPRGRRQAAPTTLLADQERGDGRQAQNRPDRERADERALGQLEQGVHQHKQHKRRQRDRGGQDGSAPERKRPPLEPGLPQPRGQNCCLGRHDWRFLIRGGALPLGTGGSSRARRTLHRPLHQCVTAVTMTLAPMASASLSL